MFGLTPRRRELEAARREYNPMEWFRREFASLFDRAFPMMPIVPSVDIEPWGLEMEEAEGEFVIRAAVPGFEPTEIAVQLTGNELTIRAEHAVPEKAPEGKETVERPYGRLVRTVTVPAGVEIEKIEARYRNGILEVHLPRAPEAKPRRIEVKT